MRRLVVFNSVSLDGFFTDARGDMSWAHADPADAEWNAFVSSNASGGGALVFGRVTYEMMAAFWPTPMAAQMMPAVAAGMNASPKYACSRTLANPTWANTTVLKGDPATEIAALKASSGPDLAVLGSGSIVTLLARAGLVDEFQLVVQPIVLGAGRTLFEGLPQPLRLTRTSVRTFGNGNVFACFAPKS